MQGLRHTGGVVYNLLLGACEVAVTPVALKGGQNELQEFVVVCCGLLLDYAYLCAPKDVARVKRLKHTAEFAAAGRGQERT